MLFYFEIIIYFIKFSFEGYTINENFSFYVVLVGGGSKNSYIVKCGLMGTLLNEACRILSVFLGADMISFDLSLGLRRSVVGQSHVSIHMRISKNKTKVRRLIFRADAFKFADGFS